MNKRIERIVSYISKTDNVIDIGCDMALLGEALAKKGIHSIAADIRKNIIENAKKRIEELKLDNYINFVVSDGLKNVLDIQFDTIVLSGMGTYTILNILKDCLDTHKKIITISNNNHDMLRIEMLKFGFVIDSEEIILDKKKYYNLIVFTRGYKEYTAEEIICGTNHKNKELLNKKLLKDLKKYKEIYKKNKSDTTKEIMNIIEKKLGYH